MTVPNNAARVDINYAVGGLSLTNVLHFNVITPPVDQGLTDDLAVAVEAWMTSDVMPNLASDLELVDVIASSYLGGGLAFQSSVVSGTNGGRVSESPEPANVAVGVTWRTALPDKSGRGRTYFPSPSSTDIGSAGQVFDPLLSGLQAAADAIVDPTWNADWRFGVYSRTDGTVRSAISAVARPVVRTQRRRLP